MRTTTRQNQMETVLVRQGLKNSGEHLYNSSLPAPDIFCTTFILFMKKPQKYGKINNSLCAAFSVAARTRNILRAVWRLFYINPEFPWT